MSDRSKIEWTDASWNPLRARRQMPPGHYQSTRVGWHCEHVTEACRNCYAEAINRRLGTRLDFKPGNRAALDLFLDEKTLLAPLHWRKPRKIFPCSMTDLFGDWVTDGQLDPIFAVMALCPQHTFIVLTKRPERMRKYLSTSTRRNSIELAAESIRPSTGKPWSPKHCFAWPLPNVWLLVSICDQPDADTFIPILLDTPAAVRGVSYEPALGPVTFAPKADRAYQMLSEWYGPQGFDPAGSQPRRERRSDLFPKIDWVICGGESSPHARPMHPDWARSARDQCKAAGVAYFFKQWGEHLPWSQFNDAGIVDHPEQTRFLTHEFENGAWRNVGYPMWCDSTDGNIDAEYCVGRVGKKRAGRLLDGVEHNGFPQIAKQSEAA